MSKLCEIMAEPPTYFEHVRQDGYDHTRGSLPYYVRLARAIDDSVETRSIFEDLSWVAFNYVKAQSRFAVIVERVPQPSAQEIDAQTADIVAWQERANQIVGKSRGLANFYDELVSHMADAALDAQRMDDEERNHMKLGLTGRINKVIVEPVTHVYSYDAY